MVVGRVALAAPRALLACDPEDVFGFGSVKFDYR
jgi:hypothetical protein